MKDLTICTVQFDIIWENPEGNFSKLEKLFEDINQPIDLLILPEMFTTGFSMDAKHIAEKHDPKTMDSLNWMRKMAKKYDSVIAGSIAIECQNKYYNRMYWVKPTGEFSYYDKHNLFAFAGEDEDYTPGNSHLVESINGWNIMPLICFDLRFPVWSKNSKKEDKPKYDLLFYSANWPETRRTHWQKLLMARSIENQSYVAGVNRTGKDGNGFSYTGDSVIIDFMGDVLTHHKDYSESIKIQILSKKGLNNYRKRFPVL